MWPSQPSKGGWRRHRPVCRSLTNVARYLSKPALQLDFDFDDMPELESASSPDFGFDDMPELGGSSNSDPGFDDMPELGGSSSSDIDDMPNLGGLALGALGGTARKTLG